MSKLMKYVIPAYLVEFWGEKRIRMMAKDYKDDMKEAGLPLDRRSWNGFIDLLEGGMDSGCVNTRGVMGGGKE